MAPDISAHALSATLQGLSLTSSTPSPTSYLNSGSFKFEIFVGFDLASSYSAIAFIRTAAGESTGILEIQSVIPLKSWPGMDKVIPVPTAISYYPGINGNLDQILWGYAASNPNFVEGFKSVAHPCTETEGQNLKLREVARQLGKNPVDFLVDYLRMSKEWIEHCFKEEWGAADFSVTKIHYEIGVPPCFTIPELRQLKGNCLAAGFEDDLLLGSEIEAMLVARANYGNLETSKVHLIVDGGALTVDAAAFMVIGVNPLKAQELSVSEGIIAGGSTLNENFREVFMGKMRFLSDTAAQQMCDTAVKEFESTIKCTFDGEDEFVANSIFGMRDDAEGLGIELKDVRVSKDEFRAYVFGPVIHAIRILVKQQLEYLKDYPDHKIVIHFCGGLLANPWIRRVLNENFQQYEVENIPYRKELTAQGLAIMRAHEKPEKDVSRVSIGVETEKQCPLDTPGVAYSHRHNGQGILPMVSVVEWIIAYGQTITDHTKVSSIKRYHQVNPWTHVEEGKGFSQKIYIVTDHIPGKRFTRVTDLPQRGVRVITQNWTLEPELFTRMDPARFAGSPFEPYRSGSGQKRYTVCMDLSATVKYDAGRSHSYLQFTAKLPRDTTAKVEDIDHRGTIPLILNSQWDTGLAGTLGTHRPNTVLSSDHSHSKLFGPLVKIQKTDKDYVSDPLQYEEEGVKYADDEEDGDEEDGDEDENGDYEEYGDVEEDEYYEEDDVMDDEEDGYDEEDDVMDRMDIDG